MKYINELMRNMVLMLNLKWHSRKLLSSYTNRENAGSKMALPFYFKSFYGCWYVWQCQV